MAVTDRGRGGGKVKKKTHKKRIYRFKKKKTSQPNFGQGASLFFSHLARSADTAQHRRKPSLVRRKSGRKKKKNPNKTKMMKEPEERERERNRENTRDNSSVPRWFHLLLPVVRRLKSIRTEFYWVSVKRNHRPPAGQSPNRNTTLLPLPPPLEGLQMRSLNLETVYNLI